MTERRLVRAVALATLASAACTAANSPPAHGTLWPPGDTLSGTILVVGAERAVRVMLRPASDSEPVEITGPARRLLVALANLEVTVAGELADAQRSFRAREFVVRAVNGVEALDGRLLAEDDRLVLVLGDRALRVQILRPPAGLRALVGMRVWIAGPPEEPWAFGIIDRNSMR